MNALPGINPFLKAAAAALFAVFALAAAAAPTPPPDRVQVAWPPDDQLSEVKDNRMQRGWLRPEDWQKTLSDYLRKQADRYLAPGERLDVTIEDIKLAGSFEPWHIRPGAEDIRYYKDIYPPYLKLHYRLTAADGSMIREEDAKLRDPSYLQRSVPTNTDPLRYDKRMVAEWVRKEFGPERG